MTRACVLLVVLALLAGCNVAGVGGMGSGASGDPGGAGDPGGSSAVDGACGGSNGVSLSAAPADNLCSAGTASDVSGQGPWTWTCAGTAGGTTASCSASVAASGGSSLPAAGNPDGSCHSIAVPADAQAVDVSHPTTVVGSGTPASCTFAALQSAVSKGGIITFDCGPDLFTFTLTESLTPPASNAYAHEKSLTIVIDGGNKVTLDGANKVRLINWTHSGSFQHNDDSLTLQHLRLINGKTTPTEKIAACPASGNIPNTECSQGYDDGEGGALYMQDGALRVVDVTFANNQAALLGPDTGGGALYVYATAHPVYITSSTFSGNKAANAGGMGMLWAGGFIINTLFDNNSAVGTGANNNDASKCTCKNNGQNEIGSGGNGGALYKDGGDGLDLTLCGTQIRNSSANEFGSGVFLTADGGGSRLLFYDSLVENNASPIPYWQWCTSVATDNPHSDSGGSPNPVNTDFCDTKNVCASTCSS